MTASTSDPDVTRVPGDGEPGSEPPPLVGRYRVGELVGRGGSGQVHLAEDLLTGARVAVKIVRPGLGSNALQLHRELTALRLVQMPGMVRLHDHGVVEDQAFLVMDALLDGAFDTLAGPWHAWREQAFTLLEAVGRLHFLGLVHGDLKPSNILLDGARPTITDFGLASGRAVVPDDDGWHAGTPRYMAPEQRRGEPIDGRSDLYALGVMFADMARPAPPEIAAVFARMQAPRPEDRYASASEVLDALGRGAGGLFGSVARLPTRAEPRDLAGLFADSDPSFLHIAEDAGARLHAVTQGDRARVQQVLDAWVRAGRCRWEGDRVVFERSALDALLYEDDLREPSVEVAREAHARGHTPRAIAVLEILPPTPAVGRQLTDYVLALWRPAVIRRGLYLARRNRWSECLGLLQAALIVSTDQAERGHDQLVQLGPLRDPLLEGWRIGLGAHAAARLLEEDRVAEWLARADEWADSDPVRRGRAASWRARVAYREGRFARALALERRAIRGAESEPVRLTRLTTGAAAALEVPELDVARRWATEARELARGLRHPLAEARSTWLLRTIALRSGHPLEPDAAWVDAAAAVSPSVAAQMALTEATAGWRLGRRALAAELALRAERGFETVAMPAAACLARGLAWMCGVGEPPGVDAVAAAPPELRLQVHAMYARMGEPLALEPPPIDWEHVLPRILDVLTGQECHQALYSKSAPVLDRS